MDPANDAEVAEMLSGNNKLMTLNDARQELERQGMSCEFMTDHMLVGVLSECRWELTGKMDVLVFVQRVPGPLTLDRLMADLQLVPSWVAQRQFVGGRCPPFGFAHARQVMLVYYAETIDREAMYEIVQRTPAREWCTATFLAAQDAQGESYYLADDKTPYWGSAFYPELRYRAGKLTGRPIDELQPPGLRCWLKFANIFAIIYLIIMSFFMPRFLLVVVGILILHCLIAVFVQWFKNRKHISARLLQAEQGEGGGAGNEYHVI